MFSHCLHIIHIIHHAGKGSEDQEHQQKVKNKANGNPDQSCTGKILFSLIGFAAKSPDAEYNDVDKWNAKEEQV